MKIMGGGIKFIMNNFHMIPWCFQFIGGANPSSSSADSCRPSSSYKQQPQKPPPAVIKVIKSDGIVKIYDKPINVSELMVQYPKHLVCNSDSFYIGQKIPALSEKDKLQLGQNYFLLPCQYFQSVLSFVTIASFAASAAAHNQHHLKVPLVTTTDDDDDDDDDDAKKNSSSTSSSSTSSAAAAFVIRRRNKAAAAAAHYCKPFDIQKTPSGCLKIRVSDEFISQLMEESPPESSSTTSPASCPGTGLNGSSNSKKKKKKKKKMKKKKNSHHHDHDHDHDHSEVGQVVDKSRGLLCTTDELEKHYKQLVEGSRLIHWKPKLESITEIVVIENNNNKKHRKLSSSSTSSSSSFRGVMKRSLSSIRRGSSEHRRHHNHHHHHHLVHFTTCAKPPSSNCSNDSNFIFRSTNKS